MEPSVKLILPLLGQATGADEAALQVPRAINSLIRSPAMMVLPAPGSSASRKRSGWRGSVDS